LSQLAERTAAGGASETEVVRGGVGTVPEIGKVE
jgi:hypothetical protein